MSSSSQNTSTIGQNGPGPGFFIPLSASSYQNGITGPSHCVFSTPKVTYSQNTQSLVNLIAKESKLTHVQRNGFAAILRSGDCLPPKWEDAVARRKEYNIRRNLHAKQMGIHVEHQEQHGQMFNRYKCQPATSINGSVYIPGARRNLQSIKATGAFDLTPKCSRKYVPRDNEEEKARFAYKMAYGTNPNPNNPASSNPMEIKSKNSIIKNQDKKDEITLSQVKCERFTEIIQEIRERVEFLQSMQTVKRDKSYRPGIIFQINEKLTEMRQLCPDEYESAVDKLQLVSIDAFFLNVG